VAHPLSTQASGDLTSVTGFQALAILPKPDIRIRKGELIQVILVAPTEEQNSARARDAG
jgi:hypothetical protein